MFCRWQALEAAINDVYRSVHWFGDKFHPTANYIGLTHGNYTGPRDAWANLAAGAPAAPGAVQMRQNTIDLMHNSIVRALLEGFTNSDAK